jgi:drug/metabolite transporter (DMT)-like permease
VSHRLLIVLGMLSIYIIWGSTYLAIRVAVETMPPFLMAGSRFFAAGIILATILICCSEFRLSKRQWIDSWIASFFMLLGGNGLVSWAEKSIPSGIATLIVALNPLFFFVAEWGMSRWHNPGNKPLPSQGLAIVGLVLGTLGLGILCAPDSVAGSGLQLNWPSVLSVIAACLCWTIGSMYSRAVATPAMPLAGSAAQMLCGGIWLLVVGLMLGEHRSLSFSSMTASSVWAWLYLLTAGSLIAFPTFVWLMKHCSPTLVATYAYVNPIVAVLLGWWILGEPIGPQVIAASIAIVAGVAIITYSKRAARKPT